MQDVNPSESAPPLANYRRTDFDKSPFLVFWEITQACDLVCKHCRACAQPDRHPEELTSSQCRDLIQQLATFPIKPILILTGGDPMKRDDVFDIVRFGIEADLTVTMTPSPTPLVTPESIAQLKAAGLSRLAVSLDGVDAATHDGIRGLSGSYDRVIEIIRDSRAVDLPVQINTMISKRNVHQTDAIAELIADLDIVLWSVFFLIPVGRGAEEERIAPEQYEEVFESLWHNAESQSYSVKTTEAHHYRRFVLQRGGNPQRGAGEAAVQDDRIQRAPLGVSDGKGCMFVSHIGQVFPSGFLPLEAGRFPRDSVIDVYQNSKLFRELRDPDGFGGKCGCCEFRQVCGGSRARAYAVTGDHLAAEPDCIYQPDECRQPHKATESR
jgi:radical SAM protein